LHEESKKVELAKDIQKEALEIEEQENKQAQLAESYELKHKAEEDLSLKEIQIKKENAIAATMKKQKEKINFEKIKKEQSL
jgi:hypothetical protein